MQIGLRYKNKRFKIDVEKLDFLRRGIGLMFKKRSKASALLFDFGKLVREPIHSFFVFFPFYALWLDDKNKIIEIKRVERFKSLIRPKQRFVKLVEIPINGKYRKVIELLDGD